LNEAVRLNPADEKAYGNRGNLWQLKGDQERTLADLDIQIRLHPKDSFGYPLRGDTVQRRSGPRDRRLQRGSADAGHVKTSIPTLSNLGIVDLGQFDLALSVR
jgi:hypothetical protein